MNYTPLQEIKEIDCGSNTDRVNEALAEGWVLLKIRLVTIQESGKIIEAPIYILGLPSP